MKKTKLLLGILTITAALLVKPCHGATWEGTDDFSGTLAKWDTTYIHLNNPSNGFFLSDGHLQFIRTETTTSYRPGAALIWLNSLPLNTNWMVMVDAHLKPLSVGSSNLIDQSVRAELSGIESVENYLGPNPKNIYTSLSCDTTNDTISTVGMDSVPVIGGGWDFTLGMSFDASTKTGTSFYYPINQQSQLVVLTNLNMSTWTNMQIVLQCLSEYWAIGPGEDWLDNFRVNGTANASPNVAIVKAVVPSFSNLILGRRYQLQVSSDMNAWTNQGSVFTATNFNMVYPQYWDVNNWNSLYFRLQVAP